MEMPLYFRVLSNPQWISRAYAGGGLSTRRLDRTFCEEQKLLSRFRSSSSDLQGKRKKSRSVRSPFGWNRVERTDGTLVLASSFARARRK